MAILLGVDTGGTYTDAVLMRDETQVIASAKALTTRDDLARGIGAAVRAVLAKAAVQAGEIGMAALSTTLATNALVEGQGGRVALVYIGFPESDLESHGLAEVLGGDPVLVLPGGHDHAGGEAAPLDEAALTLFLETHSGGLSGVAVAARFATRNPAHERRAMEIVRAVAQVPVTGSHELSARLNGPKRALTAVLNARLIGMTHRLVGRAEAELQALGVTAPLMVVRGDGALMSAAQARARPIETILSGPAASLVGARWLTGLDTALVSDIGGTTTDVALLRDGRPRIDPAGAQVGPYRTMVEAVAMRTTGLGGDSDVRFLPEGVRGSVTLGPRRVLPLALLAREAPEVVHQALAAQLRKTVPGEHDGRFVRAVPGQGQEGLSDRDAALLARIGGAVRPLGDVLRNRVEQAALRRLVARGLVQVAGVTPSDAAHVTGALDHWDTEAARMALALFARQKSGAGVPLAEDAEVAAALILAQLVQDTALALLEVGFAEEAESFGLPPEQLARHVLVQRGLAGGHRGVVRVEAGLALPVVGLGASAPTYYPKVGEVLGCDMVVPDHAGVANAIGAVVGRVVMREAAVVTVPAAGRFRAHLPDGPADFTGETAAREAVEAALRQRVVARAEAAGAGDVHVVVSHADKRAGIEGRDVLVEVEITVEAAGRPRVAEG